MGHSVCGLSVLKGKSFEVKPDPLNLWDNRNIKHKLQIYFNR